MRGLTVLLHSLGARAFGAEWGAGSQLQVDEAISVALVWVGSDPILPTQTGAKHHSRY